MVYRLTLAGSIIGWDWIRSDSPSHSALSIRRNQIDTRFTSRVDDFGPEDAPVERSWFQLIGIILDSLRSPIHDPLRMRVKRDPRLG